MVLDRQVMEVGFLEFRCSFDLSQEPSGLALVQDIGPDEDVVVSEGSFEEGWSALLNQVLRVSGLVGTATPLYLDLDTTREKLLRPTSNLKARLKGKPLLVSSWNGEFWAMNSQPQGLVALDSLQEKGLR